MTFDNASAEYSLTANPIIAQLYVMYKGGIMVRERDAVDTITGYYYQFDYYILQLIGLSNDNDTVTIEGIEDVDICDENELVAVQCKYYAKTEYNHSVIAKPIRLMLKDYVSRTHQKNIRYKLYGKYQSGHDKYPEALNVDFAKKHLFTYKEKNVLHMLHNELSLTDGDIEGFLSQLDVDINAEDYSIQQEKVINELEKVFQCSNFEAEYYYYNNALRLVKEIATKQVVGDRVISKREFLDRINSKKMLFDKWYLQFKGIREYCAEIKKQYFSPRNVSPYERFFLIECDKVINDAKLLSLIIKVSKNWSKLSKREVRPFCPYIYLNGISEERLIVLKKKLQQEDIRLLDGYDFLGADFSVASIIRRANAENNVKIKIINNLEELDAVLINALGTKEIYHFYLNEPFYDNNQNLCYGIQISSTEDIIMMI